MSLLSLLNREHKRFEGVKRLAEASTQELHQRTLIPADETIDERTVRYYIAEGLLPPTSRKKGPSSVFGYEHLLTIVLIKKLQQVDHLPLNLIKQVLSGRGLDELEQLLHDKVAVQVITDVRAISDWNKIGSKQTPHSKLLKSVAIDPERRHEDVGLDVAFSLMPSPSTPAEPPPDQGAWHRIKIVPGLELHIENSFEVPSDLESLRTLTSKIEKFLQKKSSL